MTGDRQHRWLANEDPDVPPQGLRDRCLDCGVLRYDRLEFAESVPEARRQQAHDTNERAAAPCPGPGGR